MMLLAGCRQPSSGTALFVPGPASATGTLVSAELSLHRRGTHMLMVNGKVHWYAESTTINLRTYEGMSVVLSGTLEANVSDDDLPVLVVDSVKQSLETEDRVRTDFPIIGLAMEHPAPWIHRAHSINGAEFLLPEESMPIMSLRSFSGTSLPQGQSLYVRNRPATRIRSLASHIQEVYILDDTRIIHITFDPLASGGPRSSEELRLLNLAFERIIASITFLADNMQEQSSLATTMHSGSIVQERGEQTGTICGGSAGLLCSPGWYCEIQHLEDGTGTCRQNHQGVR